MTTISDVLNQALITYDNREQRDFEREMQLALARQDAVLRAQEIPQNADADTGDGADWSQNQIALGGLGLIMLVFAGLVAYRVLD